jgi:methyltransferase (TIGR00027 family)
MAALRAAATAERDPVLRGPDDLAARFVSARLEVQTLAKLPGLRRLLRPLAERFLPGGYFYELARVKHIDRILTAELEGGLEQLLILGAGYDSRPYRFAQELVGVRVFEVDLPSVSAVKRRKAARIRAEARSRVRYVEADLGRPTLADRLSAHGYRTDAATLVILSGVAPYLEEAAVHRLFEFVGAHTDPRTSIVFDYVYDEMVRGDDGFYGASDIRRRLETLGEPLEFGLPAGGAARWTERFGLTVASDVHPADLAHRYLRRADGVRAGEPYGFAAIAHARVVASGHVHPDPGHRREHRDHDHDQEEHAAV